MKTITVTESQLNMIYLALDCYLFDLRVHCASTPERDEEMRRVEAVIDAIRQDVKACPDKGGMVA